MKTHGQRRSKLQERRVAKELGGRVQKASGATKFAKGDVRAKGLFAECKTTSKTAYILKLEDLKKITREAFQRNFSDWVFQIEFQGRGMARKFAVIDLDRYLQLHGVERTPFFSYHVHGGLSINIALEELLEQRGIYAGLKQELVFVLNFEKTNLQYALVPWETYMALKDEA